MPGLYVAYAPEKRTTDSLDRPALQALGHDGTYTVEVTVLPGLTVAQVIGSPLGHSYCMSPGGTRCWVFGTIYPRAEEDGRETRDAEYVATQYEKEGETALTRLNGEFNIVLQDTQRGRLVIVNDRFGIRPWYWAQREGDGFAVSPEVKGLVSTQETAVRLDMESVVGFLAFNKMRLGDRTMVAGVEVMPAASLWTVDLRECRTSRRTYWQFRYNDASVNTPIGDAQLDELVECYRDVMRRRTPRDCRVGLSLSGGLDSRSMVAALDPGMRADVTAHTYGLLESDEVRLAQEVATAAGMPQVQHSLQAGDYVTHATEGMCYNDEMDIFVQGAQIHWLGNLRSQAEVLMTGIDLDVTLGGIYLRPDVLEAESDADVLSLLKAKHAVFTDDELDALLGNALRPLRESPYDRAAQFVRELPQESSAAKYDLFIHRFSMRRIIMLRYAMIRYFVETASPMYDYDFIDLVSSLPLDQRAVHRTFVRFLERLSPELAAIPYQRTMLPASAPLEFWKRSADLEAAREQLYIDIWRETRGEVFIPYRRYYTNFDEWLRIDPAWLRLTDDLLQSEQSRIYAMDLVRAPYVKELVAEHRSATRSRRQQLISLMSLELYLRALTEMAGGVTS